MCGCHVWLSCVVVTWLSCVVVLCACHVCLSCVLVIFINLLLISLDKVRTTLLKKLNLSSVESWKSWVSGSMLRRRIKLYNGIPEREEELKNIHDYSVYADYCSKDVFKNFHQRSTTTSYHYSRYSCAAAFDASAKEQYYKCFSNVAEELNPDINLQNIQRKSSSFPYSSTYSGDLIFIDKNISQVNSDKTSCNLQNETCEDNLPDEVDSVNSYIMYAERKHEEDCNKYKNSKDWHSSYKYLLTVVSDRVELSPEIVHRYVQDLEHKLFAQEISEAMNKLLC